MQLQFPSIISSITITIYKKGIEDFGVDFFDFPILPLLTARQLHK
jgi:hypothetical protein